MPTPRQDALTIETPFGTAKVHDHRDHRSNTNNDSHARAALHFEDFTVNNKADGRITLYRDTPGIHRREWPPTVAPSSYSYRSITDAARRKVQEYFVVDGEVIDVLKPYMEPLDESSARVELKERLRHEVYGSLHGVIERFSYSDVEGSRPQAQELVDELLTEALAQRQDGVSYSSIYLNRKG